MPLRTFEFIDVQDWCRPAKSSAQLLELPRTWLPLLEPCRTPAIRPDWYLSGEIEEKRFLASVSTNTGLALGQDVTASGAVIAHLGPAIVKDSALLIFVRDTLALTEGYGDARWADFQLQSWPQAHNVIGIQGPGWQLGVKAYDLDESALLRLDRPCLYLSARSDDRNLYHWVFETLPRLLCLEAIPELRRLPFLVREPLTELQHAFLTWMGFAQEVIVTGGRSVLAPDLFFASIPSPPALHRPLLEWLRQRILQGLPETSGSARRRLFISRQDAGPGGRRIVNEDEVAAALQSLGFERLIMSHHSPLEQMQAFQNAEQVILPHGAAGAYLPFMPESSTLIELHAPNDINTVYFAAAKTRGLSYGALIGAGSGEGNDYRVDSQSLLQLLALTEQRRQA